MQTTTNLSPQFLGIVATHVNKLGKSPLPQSQTESDLCRKVGCNSSMLRAAIRQLVRGDGLDGEAAAQWGGWLGINGPVRTTTPPTESRLDEKMKATKFPNSGIPRFTAMQFMDIKSSNVKYTPEVRAEVFNLYVECMGNVQETCNRSGLPDSTIRSIIYGSWDK